MLDDNFRTASINDDGYTHQLGVMHGARPLDQLGACGIAVALEQRAQLGPRMNHIGSIHEQVFFKRHARDAGRTRTRINAVL